MLNYFAIPGIIKINKPVSLEEEIDNVITKVCAIQKIEKTDIFKHKRDIELVVARQVSTYIIKNKFKKLKLKELQAIFKQNHATVLHSIRTINNYLETDKNFRDKWFSLITFKVIYIAGKVTGEEYSWVEYLFNIAENYFINKGFRVINPLKHVDRDANWQEAMNICLPLLDECTHIYMLNNWRESKGAQIEHEKAQQIKLNIIYQ